ncbi:hypothetical protein [Pseudothauera lacus]|uniref:Uncharacterized protein n=1 Tax=Pseudothauera lacus TaxID=2136175 RepID=A0A2T4IAZ0_9RHOO|nr:hypothetical protein [Pseudothauera lacus]PTD94954.1 hypothetical protein C8261_16935 [Pseudothauera lacus]
MKIGKLKLIRELRDLPVVETANALHIKHIGVLEPLQKTATEHMVLDNFIEEANTAYLQTRLGGDDSAGLGVSMAALVALPGAFIFFFLSLANVLLVAQSPEWMDSTTKVIAYVVGFVGAAGLLLALSFGLQALSGDLVKDRDTYYRICRRSGKLYTYRLGRLVCSRLDDLVPCHFRTGTATAAVGLLYLVDYDREHKVARYAHKISASSPLKGDSQAIWEFYRRYIDGEFDHWRVMTQAPALEYGPMAVMRNYWPARIGRRLIDRGGAWGLPGVLVVLIGGLLVGGPWLFVTWAHGRLTGPDWSGIPAEELTPDPVEEADHPVLLKFDPVRSVNPSPAKWEKPFYTAAMALGVPVWIGLIGGGIAGAIWMGLMMLHMVQNM